jgi:hypothetical protein
MSVLQADFANSRLAPLQAQHCLEMLVALLFVHAAVQDPQLVLLDSFKP